MTAAHRTPVPIGAADDLARIIDHAVLHPTVTRAQLVEELGRVRGWPLASVCVRPCDVAEAAATLGGSAIAVGTVVGFPHGTTSTHAKTEEARRAIGDGAREIDMVINIGAALGDDWATVRDDIAEVQRAVAAQSALLKVIFETGYIADDDTTIALCRVCTEIGVAFVKTSTGFGFVKRDGGLSAPTGATEHDVALMARHAGQSVGVKASGGIRSIDDALRFVALGASRLGTGSAPTILAQAEQRFAGRAGAAPTTHYPAAAGEY